MSKVGRPKTPKNQAKTILRGAMFAPMEANEIDGAIKESGQDKSKWLREAALEKAIRQRTVEAIYALYKDLEENEWPDEVDATLTVENQPFSKGRFSLGSKLDGQGHFRPTEVNNVDKYPLRGSLLIVKGIPERLLVTNIQRCATCPGLSYHLWFEVAE